MYERIMIVLSGDDADADALAAGLELARTLSAEVVFLGVVSAHMVPMPDSPDLPCDLAYQHLDVAKELVRVGLASACALAKEQGVAASAMIDCCSDEAQGICADAATKACDIIVIGSPERTALQRWLFGGVATRLTRLSQVPVLVCKPSDGQANAVRRGSVIEPASPATPDISLRCQQARRLV
jgi:nucleotide-binding universal stress UspA family protein